MYRFGKAVQIDNIKAMDGHWEVSGYASTYGNLDFGNDVVMPGAFDAWLGSGQKTRFLYSHRPDQVLGVFVDMRSDKAGLLVRGKISQTQLGEEVYTLVKDGAVDSFSIGYITRDSEMKDGARQLKTLDLPETSLVAIPMNPQATVTAVKDYLAALGVDGEPATLAEQAKALQEQLNTLLSDTRTLLSKGRPLSNTKRQELDGLLEMFSGLDAVRSDLQSALAPATGIVEARRLRFELADHRRRLAHILQET